ncbi:MAG: CHAT domain-containing protein [Gammaproteobacteria bacterium]|nr:CHAT domain-containing protein [Gammaproteobacteria bacterium]
MPHSSTYTLVFAITIFTSGFVHANSDENHRQKKYWQTQIQKFDTQSELLQKANAWYQLGNIYFANGNYALALNSLKKAQLLLIKKPDAGISMNIAASLGAIYVHLGYLKQAEPLLTDSLKWAQKHNKRYQSAAIYNDLGNLYLRQKDFYSALNAYENGIELLKTNKDNYSLLTRLKCNATISAQLLGKYTTARKYALSLSDRIQGEHQQDIMLLIRVGQVLNWLISNNSTNQQIYASNANTALRKALEFAIKTKDKLLQAQAEYSLSHLYYIGQRYDDALALNRQALLHSQNSNSKLLIAQFQWQAGRIFIAQNNLDKAIDAYDQAIRILPKTSANLTLNPQLSIDHTSGNIHLEYAQLLLKKSEKSNDLDRKKYLFRVRDAVEALKAAELQDYFQDDCVTATQTRIKKLEEILNPGTAVLYPILFDDRIELLLSNNKNIHRFVSKVSKTKIKELVTNFRQKLEKRRTRDYLPYSKELYDLIIRPVMPTLKRQKVSTLITISGTGLQGVPFSALHDGEEFLIQKMAVAISPGLHLTDSSTTKNRSTRILLSGLTESVQGFPALIHVKHELDNINKIHPGKLLIDQSFQSKTMKSALGKHRYNIAHIASHGKFTGNVSESFLLTYDSQVRVSDLAEAIGLGRFADEPLELLTLSACDTAAGDDRAMLGLAGITVKAGARSALATLWPINDRATSILMTSFYNELQNNNTSKANALRNAQLNMLADVRHRHPGYWSPFILIGNWR